MDKQRKLPSWMNDGAPKRKTATHKRQRDSPPKIIHKNKKEYKENIENKEHKESKEHKEPINVVMNKILQEPPRKSAQENHERLKEFFIANNFLPTTPENKKTSTVTKNLTPTSNNKKFSPPAKLTVLSTPPSSLSSSSPSPSPSPPSASSAPSSRYSSPYSSFYSSSPPSSVEKLSPHPVKYNSTPSQSPVNSKSTPPKISPPRPTPKISPKVSPITTPPKLSSNTSPKISPPKFSPKVSPKISPPKISPKISPRLSPRISPSDKPKPRHKRKLSPESPNLTHSPQFQLSFGNSPLRSPTLSPDFSHPPSPKFNVFTDITVKNTLEFNNDDNDSNYSESDGSGSEGEGSENESELNESEEREEDEFALFANDLPFTFSPLPSPELSGGEEKEGVEERMLEKKKRKSTFICDHPCSARAENKNKQLTDALESIQRLHAFHGEQWQEMSLRKAITTLKRHPEHITRISQIIAFLEGKPVFATGHAQLELFSNVWGAGPKSVKHWISKGYTNLEQLLHDPDLTLEQRIGIKYYNAFKTRIPRSEVEKHVAKVAEIILQMPSSATASVIAAGSYRRGREDCGDIDILVLHPSTKPIGVLQDLVGRLHKANFLIDDLQLSQLKHRDWSHHHDKYLGVSKVGSELARRIDILVVPAGSHAATLMYMTGSSYFNRSLRLKSKKIGYYLCNHAVARADINGKRVGPPIPVHTEEDIFALLSTPYQPPHARDW